MCDWVPFIKVRFVLIVSVFACERGGSAANCQDKELEGEKISDANIDAPNKKTRSFAEEQMAHSRLNGNSSLIYLIAYDHYFMIRG